MFKISFNFTSISISISIPVLFPFFIVPNLLLQFSRHDIGGGCSSKLTDSTSFDWWGRERRGALVERGDRTLRLPRPVTISVDDSDSNI